MPIDFSKFQKKVEIQEEKKPEIKKISPEVRLIEPKITKEFEVEKIPSRFLSGICAILNVKGYGLMSKQKLLDTLINIFDNERKK